MLRSLDDRPHSGRTLKTFLICSKEMLKLELDLRWAYALRHAAGSSFGG